MKGAKISNIKAHKKKIIKANIYKPGDKYSTNTYLKNYNRSSRSRNSDDGGYCSDIKLAKSRNTPLKVYNTNRPIGSPLVYNIENSYKKIENRRRKAENKNSFTILSTTK